MHCLVRQRSVSFRHLCHDLRCGCAVAQGDRATACRCGAINHRVGVRVIQRPSHLLQTLSGNIMPQETNTEQSMSSIRAGGQDWLTIWRKMYESERAQGEAATDPEFSRYADYWAGRAERFAATSQRQPQPDSFMRALLPHLRPDDTVLDIGAGTGRYLPTLAATVRKVIAIEPSAAMRAEMERLITTEKLHNVTIIDAPWPTQQPVSGDVAISAHVVYSVAEIEPFLQAMNNAARRSCHLYVGLQAPSHALAAFWEYVHGEPRLPLPAALEALACLHQCGIYARMDLVPIPGSFRFTSMNEAMEEIRHRMRLTPRPDRDARIMEAINKLLVPMSDGCLSIRDQPSYAALLSWSVPIRSS